MPRKNFVAAAILAGTALSMATSAQAKLDKSMLQARIATRVEKTINLMADSPDREMNIGPEDIHLQQIEPVTVSLQDYKIPLYAVKAILDIPGKKKTSAVRMVVDGSGRYQVAIKDICTGQSLLQKARDNINRQEIASDLGQKIYTGPSHIVKTKDPTHELLFASDPFCPYCRKAFEYFYKNRQLISEWRVVHLPYHKQYGADAAVWAIMDGADTVDAMKLMRFAYEDLVPAKEDNIAKRRENIIIQFMDEFPTLKEKWGVAEQARYYLKGKYGFKVRKDKKEVRDIGVKKTPGVFIDGVLVKGWNPIRYDNLLRVKNGPENSVTQVSCP